MEQQPNSSTPKTPEAGGTQEVEQFQSLIREYGQSILIGLTIAVVVFLGFAVYRNYKQSNEQKASQMLFSARSAEELQQIAAQYGDTKAAPLALLSAASMAFEAGQYEPANYVFTQFQQRYPSHALLPSAELGIAQCLEASGQLEAGEKAFDAFLKAYPKHFLMPMAALGRARCLEQMGRFDEAKAVYEDFIAANPENPWTSQAESGLLFLEKTRRAGPAQTPAPASVFSPSAQPFPIQVPTEEPAAH